LIAAQTHIIALRAGTGFRQINQCDIAEEAKTIGVVVMQVGGYDRDRQLGQTG
jgi:hypothetical protein